jgi:toxin FitB
MIILDTNVLSELMKPRPAERVLDWIAARPATSLYTTSITEAEIVYGVLLLPDGKRRRELELAVDAMLREDLGGRILPFSSGAARSYARIAVDRRKSGRPIAHPDAQIAAIARANDATLATRNVLDFEDCGLTIVDPWA